jgi:hypothetical protein
MKNFAHYLLILLSIILISYISYEKYEDYQAKNYNLEAFPKAIRIEVPANFDFAGEKVPTYETEVRERFDRELYVNIYWQAQTGLIIKRVNRWFPQIEKILKEEGVPDDFKYIAVIESDLRNVVSPVGATGFWQFMEGTGKEFGLKINEEVDERYDPIKSTYAACKYFKKAYKKFGNWTLAAASYNRGMGGVNYALRKQKAKSFYDLRLNTQTARYLYRALAFKEILQNPAKYDFHIPRDLVYQQEKMNSIEIDTTIHDLPAFSKLIGVSYKTLKYYNPWLRKYALTVKEDEVYTLQLPKNAPSRHSAIFEEKEREEELVAQEKQDALAKVADSLKSDSLKLKVEE